MRRARFLPAAGPFRASYGYSNLMFIAAGEVIAAVSGAAPTFPIVADVDLKISKAFDMLPAEAYLPDGRAWMWRQMNACGHAVFDGKDAPEGCPPRPE